jgi:hypothetical protein
MGASAGPTNIQQGIHEKGHTADRSNTALVKNGTDVMKYFRDYNICLRNCYAAYSGRRRLLVLRRGRSTCNGLRAGTDPPDGYAGVHRGKRTTRPRSLPGACRRVSPMLGIFGPKLLHADRQTRLGPGGQVTTY